MSGMQLNKIGMNWPYNQYQYMFSVLAFWHLRSNYLKIVWELFYPGGLVTKKFTL